jgi:ubiquinone/menaquinone biosynthesis C-methylase UbiE
MGVAQRPTAVEVHSQQAAEFAASYHAYERDAYASCFTYSRMRLEQMLDEHIPPNGEGLRALDVGCGTGHHLSALAARGFDVAGIDGSDHMLEEARAANPAAELQRADVASLPFSDGGFDLVLCVEVLRYLADPNSCITEMARVLRPDGVCLATAAPLFSINGYALINRLAVLAPIGDFVRLKQYFTTPLWIRRRFEAVGFREVEVHGVYTGPVNWVERLAPERLGSLLRRWEPVDRRLADHRMLRGVSNMLLVKASRPR